MGRLKVIIMALVLWMSALQGIWAQEGMEWQEKKNPLLSMAGWYGGIEGGVPFGISTFNSFGADKTRAGYAFGLFGGYRFNPAFSTELMLKWGKSSLTARDCCATSDYWLGTDGITYHSAVLDMAGHSYSDLKSDVSLRQYGMRLNVNLFGLFAATKQSRWTLDVSPMLAAVGAKATVETITAGDNLINGKTRWHLGVGGNLQVAYALTSHLHLGIYSGITWLSGEGMDGIAEHVHKANYLWESGVRIGWTFGQCHRKEKKDKPEILPPVIVAPETTREVCPEKTEEPTMMETDTTEQYADSLPDEEKTGIIGVEAPDKADLTFPIVYFDFNRTDIKSSETVKLQVIHDILRTYPDTQILVTGWCDNVGSHAVNIRISQLRAESVKRWLVNRGIEPLRIKAQGKGIDYEETDPNKARHTVTEKQAKEERK